MKRYCFILLLCLISGTLLGQARITLKFPENAIGTPLPISILSKEAPQKLGVSIVEGEERIDKTEVQILGDIHGLSINKGATLESVTATKHPSLLLFTAQDNNIKSIELADCPKLTKVQLNKIAQLSQLKLTNCNRLVALMLIKLNVEEFHFYGCDALKKLSQKDFTYQSITLKSSGKEDAQAQAEKKFTKSYMAGQKKGIKLCNAPDKMCEFPGGTVAMYRFISERLEYPKLALKHEIQGKVFLRFTVKEDGSIADIKIIKGVEPSLDNEAMRVVKEFPKFIPAEKDGKPVSVTFGLPIVFKLQ